MRVIGEGDAPPDSAPALFGLRAALAFFAGGALIGGPWDMLYHMQTPFESFFSPPHLFIYGMTAASVLIVAVLAARGELRAAFGPARRLKPLRVELPGSLLLLGAGLGVLLLSGAIDEFWHARFGLDETRFSTPHAMFGWGLFVAALGFASARRALARAHPIKTAEACAFTFLLLSFSLYAFLLAFLVYPTPEAVRAIAGLPAVAAQPSAAHTFRIYEAWGIDRTNPAFLVIAAAWAGAATTLCGAVSARARPGLIAAAAATALYTALWLGFAARLGIAQDPRAWLPLPLLAPLLLGPLRQRFGWHPSRVEWAAGALFVALTAAVWTPAGDGFAVLYAVIAGIVAFKASLLGSVLVLGAVVEPGRRWAPAMPLVLGVAVPLLTGLVDLWMRTATP